METKDNLTPEEQKAMDLVKSMIDERIKGVDAVSKETMDLAVKSVKEEISKTTAESSKLYEDLNKAVSELAGKMEEKFKNASINMAKKSEFRQSLDEALASDKFNEFAKGGFSKRSGEFELKGIAKAMSMKGVVSRTGNLTTANDTAFPFQSTEVVEEVPINRPSLRNLIPTIDASADEFDSWAFHQILNINRAAAAVAENGVLPEGSFEVKEVVTQTKRIGWHIPLSKRLMKRRFLGDYVANLMPAGMTQQENFQLLYGDDQSANFKGLTKYAPTESVLTADIYDETAAAGKIKSIESWDNGAATKINFVKGYPKIETGMTITCSNFQTATSLNAAKTLTKYNDEAVIVPVSYTAETASSVLANAKFKVTNSWAASVPDANVGDAIAVALAYLMFGQFVPTAILMNPVDYTSFSSIKDANGRKIFADYVTVSNGTPYFGGIYPIYLFPEIAKGHMLIGDFQRGCKLIDTQAGSLEFAEDTTTMLKNTVEAIIQEETIFEVSVPEAFMYITTSTLISAITTSNTNVLNVNVTNNSLDVNSTIASPLTQDGEVKVKSV